MIVPLNFDGSDNGDSQTHALVRSVDSQMTVPSGVPTWMEAVEAYLHAAVDSIHTRRAYRRHLRRAGALFNCQTIREIVPADLAMYRAAIIESDLAPASQAQALAALRSFLAWTGDMGGHQMSAHQVRAALRNPRWSSVGRYTTLTESEIGRLFEVAKTERDRAILAVLIGAGLRVAEAAALDLGDLAEDMEGRMVLTVRQGKGRKDRIVPVGLEVDKVLRTYVSATGRYLGAAGRLFLATDRAAPGRKVAALSTRTLSRVVKQLAEDAGIEAKRISPHALRHTFALRTLRSGANVVAVARLLGHANIATTQRYVDHLSASELRDAIPPLPLSQTIEVDGPKVLRT